MEQKVKLKITGMHGSGGDSESVAREMAAQYFQKNGAHFFFYEEKEEDFAETLKTRLKYRDGVLEILRKGSCETQMIFQKGKVYHTNYRTPVGDMHMELDTKELMFEERGSKIHIFAKYRMCLNENYETDSTIEITAWT